MSYNPNEHKVTARQVLAGWVVCLVVAGLAFAALAAEGPVSFANGGRDPHAGPAVARCLMSGVLLPSFADCTTAKRGAVRLARGPALSPADRCG